MFRFVSGWSRERRAAIGAISDCACAVRALTGQPAKYLEPSPVSSLIGLIGELRQEPERLPHIADEREPETVWHDADDEGRHTVDDGWCDQSVSDRHCSEPSK